MARAKLRLGEGATVSVLLSMLCPSQAVAERFPNKQARQRPDDLVAVRKDWHTRGPSTYMAVFYSSPTFPGVELHAAWRYSTGHVLAEGPTDKIWSDDHGEAPGPPHATEGGDFEARDIDPSIFDARNRAEDIAFVRQQGFFVDDDNEPDEENIPRPDVLAPSNADLYPRQKWGWDGIDHRRNLEFEEPSFKSGWTPIGKSYLDVFLHVICMNWLTDQLLAATNAALETENHAWITFGEFVRYLGLRLLMASCSGWPKASFWSTKEPVLNSQENRPPYRFNEFMSQRRFDLITRELRFTSAAPPAYKDRFWEVRMMIDAFNCRMQTIFSSCWAICLDESMSIWHNRWTCPGWVFCPRKPHPFGNEYHTACCAKSGILFSIEIVEGKDAPQEGRTSDFDDRGGKTTGLLLRMLRGYFGTGKYVILDSGFCVLNALTELKKMGVFACALIKKRRYWPALVPGDAMDQHIGQLNVGESAAISGTHNGVPYNIWGMKEPDYVMKLMATGGQLLSDNTCKETKRTWKVNGVERTTTFKYPFPVDWHFKYRHAIDDHNNLRHALPSIEDAWSTIRWPVRVFSFILALTEANAFLSLRYFVFRRNPDGCPTLLEFRRDLAWQMINNPFLQRENEAGEILVEGPVHDLKTAPNNAKMFRYGRWICTAKYKYQQYHCRMRCGKRTRLFCSCNPGYWVCQQCHHRHVLEAS